MKGGHLNESATTNLKGSSSSSSNSSTSHRNKNEHGGALLLLLFFALFACQFGVLYWKKYHFRSYHTFTLYGLWLIPMLLAVMMGNFRFIVIWTLFSIAAGYIINLAVKRPLSHETPR